VLKQNFIFFHKTSIYYNKLLIVTIIVVNIYRRISLYITIDVKSIKLYYIFGKGAENTKNI